LILNFQHPEPLVAAMAPRPYLQAIYNQQVVSTLCGCEFGRVIAFGVVYAERQDSKFKLEKTHDEVEAGKERQEAGKREAAGSHPGAFPHQAADEAQLVFEFVPCGPQNPRVIEVAPREPPSQERRPSFFSPPEF
jgi:hypothetical protein